MVTLYGHSIWSPFLLCQSIRPLSTVTLDRYSILPLYTLTLYGRCIRSLHLVTPLHYTPCKRSLHTVPLFGHSVQSLYGGLVGGGQQGTGDWARDAGGGRGITVRA